MAIRERPHVVSTRVRREERALLRAVAEARGLSVSDVIHELVMAGVRDSLAGVMGVEPAVRDHEDAEPAGAAR